MERHTSFDSVGQSEKGNAPIILAGNLQQEAKVKTVTRQEAETSNALADDPWRSYIENKGGTGLAQTAALSKVNVTPVLSQPPRKLEAPIEDRFNAHQTALQDLRDKGEKDVGGSPWRYCQTGEIDSGTATAGATQYGDDEC